MSERQKHRDFAAHRVSNNVHRPVSGKAVLKISRHKICHVSVVERIRPVRCAVVRHIHQEHLVVIAKPSRDPREVLAASHQTVQKSDLLRTATNC